jgi:hypothetical protein
VCWCVVAGRSPPGSSVPSGGKHCKRHRGPSPRLVKCPRDSRGTALPPYIHSVRAEGLCAVGGCSNVVFTREPPPPPPPPFSQHSPRHIIHTLLAVLCTLNPAAQPISPLPSLSRARPARAADVRIHANADSDNIGAVNWGATNSTPTPPQNTSFGPVLSSRMAVELRYHGAIPPRRVRESRAPPFLSLPAQSPVPAVPTTRRQCACPPRAHSLL